MKTEILKRALERDKFQDLHIVDCHCHVGSGSNFYAPENNLDKMIYDADIVGVEKICVCLSVSTSSDSRLGNSIFEEAVEKHPGRLMGLIWMRPDNLEEMLGQLDKYYSMKEYIGVKIHPTGSRYNVAGENYLKVYERIQAQGGFILSHTWEDCPYCDVYMFEDILKAYPRCPFVLGHMGGRPAAMKKAMELANNYENLYLDTCGFEFSNTSIEEIMRRTDPTKVLFGSDYSFHDIRGPVSRILFENLDDEVKTDILSRNFYEMLAKWGKKT